MSSSRRVPKQLFMALHCRSLDLCHNSAYALLLPIDRAANTRHKLEPCRLLVSNER